MELNKIHNIDCLEFMKTLPDKCIDLVLTDPPYGRGYTSFGNDSKDQRMWMKWMKEILKEFRRILKPNSMFFIFIDWRNIPALSDCIQESDLIWQGVGSWAKPSGFYRPRLGGMAQNCEFIVWGSNGDLIDKTKYIEGDFKESINKTTKNPYHPAQKPLEVTKRIIELCNEKSVIFDPFIGSGTTAVACKMLGRNYIGCEISKEYCDIAEQRIKSISNPLF